MSDDDPPEEDDDRCPHRHTKSKYGGVCCLDCGEILQEPGDGR